MQERSVRGVDADFERLQPVAVDVPLESKDMAVGRDEAVDLGESRRRTPAEISPQNAPLLDARIGALLDAFAQLRVPGLARRFQAWAGCVEKPAMEGQTPAAVFEP